MTKKIFCTGCNKDVIAQLTNGEEMYPQRKDLYDIPFWICDTCKAFVGCHWKTNQPTKPLGVLATQELKDARKSIHAVLDPFWRSGKIGRGRAYAYVSNRIGKEYHNGEIRSVEEARSIYHIVATLHNELVGQAALI